MRKYGTLNNGLKMVISQPQPDWIATRKHGVRDHAAIKPGRVDNDAAIRRQNIIVHHKRDHHGTRRTGQIQHRAFGGDMLADKMGADQPDRSFIDIAERRVEHCADQAVHAAAGYIVKRAGNAQAPFLSAAFR